MYNGIAFDSVDMTLPAPTEEPLRQRWFMKRARLLLEKRSRELGRPLTAMVKTFGCPKNDV